MSLPQLHSGSSSLPLSLPMGLSVIILFFNATCLFWICLELWIVWFRTNTAERRNDRFTGSLLGLCVFAAIYSSHYFLRYTFFSLPGSIYFHLMLGVTIMWLGLILRVSSIYVLGRFFRGAVIIQKDHEIIDSTLYRHIRHPSYTGALIASIGYGICIGNIVSIIIIFVLFFIGLHFRIRYEEESLLLAFGNKYSDYIKRTKKLIPYIY